MKHFWFITLFAFFCAVAWGVPLALAEVDEGVFDAGASDEPIEIDPSYNDCFRMAQDALKAEQLGVEMQADVTRGADPMDVPAETPATQKRKQALEAFYPGLGGDKDFEAALLESGAKIIIDPENPGAAPRVELSNARPPAPPETTQAGADGTTSETVQGSGDTSNKDKAPSAAEIFQQKKDVCRIKYGISF